jgi:hypothetical protein
LSEWERWTFLKDRDRRGDGWLEEVGVWAEKDECSRWDTFYISRQMNILVDKTETKGPFNIEDLT